MSLEEAFDSVYDELGWPPLPDEGDLYRGGSPGPRGYRATHISSQSGFGHDPTDRPPPRLSCYTFIEST